MTLLACCIYGPPEAYKYMIRTSQRLPLAWSSRGREQQVLVFFQRSYVKLDFYWLAHGSGGPLLNWRRRQRLMDRSKRKLALQATCKRCQPWSLLEPGQMPPTSAISRCTRRSRQQRMETMSCWYGHQDWFLRRLKAKAKAKAKEHDLTFGC
jgi:hypothetical protein